jgi:hypothetical protein
LEYLTMQHQTERHNKNWAAEVDSRG